VTKSNDTNSPSPYVDQNGRLRYKRSLVLVIDALGTTASMSNGVNDQALNEQAERLDQATEWIFQKEFAEYASFSTYTDNMLFARPLDFREHLASDDGDAVLQTAAGLANLQYELMLGGTAIRGGMTIGAHHQSSRHIHGPALIAAHHLEQNTATFPRVVLSHECRAAVVRAACSYGGGVRAPEIDNLIVLDDGEYAFVSYLAAVDDSVEPYSTPEEHFQQVAEELEKHAIAVQQGLTNAATTSINAAAKWEWLAAYHNHFARYRGHAPNRAFVRYEDRVTLRHLYDVVDPGTAK